MLPSLFLCQRITKSPLSISIEKLFRSFLLLHQVTVCNPYLSHQSPAYRRRAGAQPTNHSIPSPGRPHLQRNQNPTSGVPRHSSHKKAPETPLQVATARRSSALGRTTEPKSSRVAPGNVPAVNNRQPTFTLTHGSLILVIDFKCTTSSNNDSGTSSVTLETL